MMNFPAKSRSPEKRVRDLAELEEQARLFRADWRAGDRVQTWLNRHEGRAGELSDMVRAGWLWADIGRAMHMAGIAYSTGSAITADILRKKASRARAGARAKRLRVPLAHAYPLERLPPAAPETVGRTLMQAADEEPQFKPATLVRHSGTKRPDTPPMPRQEAVQATDAAIDVPAVLARFTGRTHPIPK